MGWSLGHVLNQPNLIDSSGRRHDIYCLHPEVVPFFGPEGKVFLLMNLQAYSNSFYNHNLLLMACFVLWLNFLIKL